MDHLQTEARNPASADLDALTPLQLVRLMNAEDARVAPAVAAHAEAIARAIEVIAERLAAGGRLVYAGAGTSGRLGVLDATECPPTFNAAPGQVVGVIAGGYAALTQAVEGAEDRPELGEQDLQALQFSAKDVLVGIATSGRTPYVLGALAYARQLGAFTIGLACNADADLVACVDLAITPVVGPEVLSGSTRLKAGTATKLVLNTLTTGAMVRLGKTFGNLMVDLRATNTKLRARSNRIVRQLTGLTQPEAEELLAACQGELKTSLVSHLAGLTPAEGRARLSAAGGQVRAALRGAANAAKQVLHSDLYLGIDGGGTHTRALLARASEAGTWTLLGSGQSGPSNVQAVGGPAAIQALDEAVAAAFAQAGLPRGTVRVACLGLAGAGRVEGQTLVHAWAEQIRLAHQVEVTGDTALLLEAGTPQGWGLALVAGTGSMAYGRAPDGRTARAGGWGYLLGDEGSGYAVAMAGLHAVTLAADGRGPQTELTAVFLEKMGATTPAELVPRVHGDWDRTALASLAPLVFANAGRGDAVAQRIVVKAAGHLAEIVAATARALAIDTQVAPLALAGGLLLAHDTYRELILQELSTLAIHVAPVALVEEPAEGALRRAAAQDLKSPA